MEFELMEMLAAGGWWDSTVEWCSGIFTAIGDWFSGIFGKIGEFIKGLGPTIIWICVIVLLIAGFAGTVIPFLPGTTLILAGVYLHYFALGRQESDLSWVTLVIIGILYVAALVVDNFSGAIGAKWFGSSKWGIVGAILGALVGLCFGLPGIIIGPIVGVFVFEMIFGKKKVKEAGSSTVGTVVGSGAGLLAGIGIGILMLVCYALDLFVFK